MITQNIQSDQVAFDRGYLSLKPGPEISQIEINEFTTVGRDAANKVQLDDPSASQRHFRIEAKSGGFLLRDLKSRNGTYINGTRVFEALLSDGDRITAGRTDLVFSLKRLAADETLHLTSRNLRFSEQLGRLETIAQSNFPVLLNGPSGSGKDVIAQCLHRLSNRSKGPYVSINCSALSESLFESELFGHVKGSFTGATGDRKGAFESARGGTLFLDEIGDLPMSLQPKLLRALENREIQAVGSDRPITTDVRVVAATHQNLKSLVKSGHFRADLFYRLYVVHFQVPGLNQRMEDFEDILYKFAKEYRVRFSHPAILALKKHSWPGHIRELKNTVARSRALFMSREIQESDVPAIVDALNTEVTPNSPVGSGPSRSAIKAIECEMIKQALVTANGNQRRAASELGLAKSTLHDRIKHFGINIPELLHASPRHC